MRILIDGNEFGTGRRDAGRCQDLTHAVLVPGGGDRVYTTVG